MNRDFIPTIFESLQDEIYSVVKFDSERLNEKGADIDIYCENSAVLGKKILTIGNELLLKDVLSKIKVTEIKKEKHVHIDFFANNELEIRFDLYGKLPVFEKLAVKKDLFQAALTNRMKKNGMFVPNHPIDLLIRYLEYVEYFPERSSKAKHLDYVSKHLQTEEDRKDFLEILKMYILEESREKKRPNVVWGKIKVLPRRIVRKLWKILRLK